MTHGPDAASRRAFHGVLANTFIASLTTNFLWFALTFWVYLETRSVLATSILGGSYMLLVAVLGVPFGSLVDRHHKKKVMSVATLFAAAAYALAFVFYLVTPKSELLHVGGWAFWTFILLILAGAIVENIRGIALGTCVTLLVPAGERDKANGLVGMVLGVGFGLMSVFSGLAVGLLGMTWVIGISVVVTGLAWLHLLTVRMHEPEIVHADGVPKPVDFAGAWRAVRRVPALIWLIAFATINNLIGGVFMALLDPYGLSLMSVETWGIVFGVVGFGFLIGGAVIGKWGLGGRPLRTLLVVNVIMWIIGGTFAIRESIVLLAVGIFVYMALIPFAEAAEQTVLQRVVPVTKQGRVFGFAKSIEVAAAPISSFLIGPIAQFGLIPYMESPEGRAAWGWLLGDGDARGIALVFVLSSIVGLVVTIGALASRPYRTLSDAYATASPTPAAPAPGDPLPPTTTVGS